jgi:phage FluMu protein Com
MQKLSAFEIRCPSCHNNVYLLSPNPDNHKGQWFTQKCGACNRVNRYRVVAEHHVDGRHQIKLAGIGYTGFRLHTDWLTNELVIK